MPPLEAWEKVLLETEAFGSTVHGQIACIDCHGGSNEPSKETAHAGLVADPSETPGETCGQCHPDLIEPQTHSLHYTLQGYDTTLQARSDPEHWDHLEEMMGNHCDSCHATCGQCHVSQPTSVGGGLLDGHNFVETPPMSRTCTACHGSRIGNEFLGKNEGFKGDVHFRQGRMACVACHTSDEMHGQPDSCQTCHVGPEPEGPMPEETHRYDGLQQPRCETCHTTVAAALDDVEQHQVHGGDLACQVCHAVDYKSCDGCHVQLNQAGQPYFYTEGSQMTFYIGRNPIPSYERPYEFVLVRHVPISEDSFAFYGDNLLPNMQALPTWRYTTPHNIQLETPQNESCNACHGNSELFLTEDKIAAEELQANQNILVDQVPPTIEITEE